jgi:REP element-mobilizing transposase RayT
MPDHVHLFLEGVTDNADLREAVRVWKQIVGYEWKRRSKRPLWQTGSRRSHYRWSGSSLYTFDQLAEHAGDWRPSW